MCVSRNPADVRYIHERAKANQMIEYHDAAVNDFDDVIKKNPKNAHAHFRRAFSLKALGQECLADGSKEQKDQSKMYFQKAADDFESAKNLDPMNPKLVVNYKKLKGITCIVLCEPGEEKTFV